MKWIKTVCLLINSLFAFICLSAQETTVQWLSGTDKDHTVNWDFLCTTGRNSGRWSKIPVPSNWEMQGFGTYNYYQDIQNPDEQGFYKYSFDVLPEYRKRKIYIVFEASMTDTEVKINGKLAGPVHQGGFYEFRYDITDLLMFDKANQLEVKVSKHSTNESINRAERKADFWLFGGIFRPVYLEIVPLNHIERVAIDARASGDLNMQIFNTARSGQHLRVILSSLNGKLIGEPMDLKSGDSILHVHVDSVRLWNPEEPNLYNATIQLMEGDQVIHSIKQRFGFRTAELRRGEGFFLNGSKVVFKGVCRHSEWPESGRTLSRSVHLLDIQRMKSMNMNAVRMSHYPPDKLFLDLCDSLGLMVLDELTGWQASYDTLMAGKLVRELVTRDVNHPSIMIWDNGNEGGWNTAVDDDYALYDPQKRQVIHPWARFNGTNTKHYPDFKYLQEEALHGKDVFFPTEFMHGLFDGGAGAGLDDFWKEMRKNPLSAGGFLWSFHDEGIVRADRHDSIDVAGNAAPDGVLGPYRQKEASFYTIKEIWSPVYIETNNPDEKFTGKVTIENRYLFTNLDQIHFEWKVVSYSRPGHLKQTIIVQSGRMKTVSVLPAQQVIAQIPFTQSANADVVYLYALNLSGDSICTWSWALRSPADYVKPFIPVPKISGITVQETSSRLTVHCDRMDYYFDKGTGSLQKVFNGKKWISISGGVSLAGSDLQLIAGSHQKKLNQYAVQWRYSGDSLRLTWLFESGKLPKLRYEYLLRDTADYSGIGFQFPEKLITGVQWMGRGPYRVWKNRLKGQQLGVWNKDYNNTVTGESWDYPEFKGWHAGLYWVKLLNKEADFTIYSDQPGVYLQLLQPQSPKAAMNTNVSPAFPNSTLGFMHSISPIGTKFQRASLMGPQSQPNTESPGSHFSGILYFDFR